jgi:2-polyprenyl-3-methyl-5-hydroxy-6-metoxy-1,4-benzoquinol methylase
MSLRTRHRRPEVMDQPGLEPARHADALRGLARINGLSGAARILWRPLADFAHVTGRPLRVLDLATGGGDVPLRMWRRARRQGLDLQVEGCDLSPVAVEHARALAAQEGAPVRFFVHDALAGPPRTDYDVVTCSLFLHHLDEDQGVTLLRNMAAAGRLVLIHDLQRGAWSWLLAWVVTRLLSRSDVVHTDGPISVEGAFTAAEARALAERAGLHGAVVTRHWPCRFRLLWRRP